jgi:hypothetical protein
MALSPQEVRKIGEFYAYQFEKSRLKGSGQVYKLKQGKVVDIVSTTTTQQDEASIFNNLSRLIEAKGSSASKPVDVPIYKSLKTLKPEVYPSKYYVYIVYNVRLNKTPCLVEVDGHYVENFKKEVKKRNTINLHKVHYHVKNGRLKVYDFPVLTKETLKDIKKFAKGVTSASYAHITEHIFSHRHKELVKYIESLGSDVRRESQKRLCFSYLSKKAKKRYNLILIYPKRMPHEEKPFTVHIRNDAPSYAPHIQYPSEITTISGYISKANTSDFYPKFKIVTDDDIEKAKRIIEFAYDNL